MTVSNLPMFGQKPDAWNAVATTAFSLTGAGSLLDNAPTNTVLIGTAGPEGALFTGMSIVPRATCTATMAAIFLRKSTDAAGVRRLLKSVLVPAFTVATTTAITETDVGLGTETSPFRIGPLDELYFGIAVTQSSGIVVNAREITFTQAT